MTRPAYHEPRYKEAGLPIWKARCHFVVSEAGLEPARPFSQSLAPQASASANSATPTCQAPILDFFLGGVVGRRAGTTRRAVFRWAWTATDALAEKTVGPRPLFRKRGPPPSLCPHKMSVFVPEKSVDRYRHIRRENRRVASPHPEAWTASDTSAEKTVD